MRFPILERRTPTTQRYLSSYATASGWEHALYAFLPRLPPPLSTPRATCPFALSRRARTLTLDNTARACGARRRCVRLARRR
jgi:hypothetical protein